MFTLEMETRGAAFAGGGAGDGPGPEVARILREIADRLDVAGTGSTEAVQGNCRDFNGNTVGTFELLPETF